MVNALAILDTAPERSYTFFEVVDFGAGRKKVARTSQQLRAARMCQPVSVQFWQPRPADGGEDTYVVQPVGPPEVVDLMFLAEWQILRAGLRKWARTSTGQPGCLTLTQPLAVCQTAWNWRNGDEVPQVAILDHLATQGWRHGPIVSHTLFTPKHLRPPTGKGGTAKAYFQCLACLPDLLQPTFPELRAGQPCDYYGCVLATDKPQDIPLDLKPNAYARHLRSLARWGTLADMALVAAPQDAQGDEDIPMAAICDEPVGARRKAPAKLEPLGDAMWEARSLKYRSAGQRAGVKAEKKPKTPLQDRPTGHSGHPRAASSSTTPAAPAASSTDRPPAKRPKKEPGQPRQQHPAESREVVHDTGDWVIQRDYHIGPDMAQQYRPV